MNITYQSKITVVKRINYQNNVTKKITTLPGIKRKLLIGKESKSIIKKIKETLRYLKSPNYINKISYMFRGICPPNLLYFIITYLVYTRRL